MSSDILPSQSTAGENDENVKLPPSKVAERNMSSRPALKPLSQNIGRIQPFRAAKQNATKEGFFSIQGNTINSKFATSEGFKIFSETPSTEVTKPTKKEKVEADTSKSQLHPALTSLPVCRIPLRTLQVKDTKTANVNDSPMILDVSEEERLNIFDIDNEEGLFGFSEYAVEIFEHLREAELLHRPKPNYMRKQQDITTNMRSILVDWLIEVAEEYRLHNETAHLAVNYLDRFLSQMAVLRGKLQLVGTAAMFLASKFEEIYPPDVGEYVYITDDTYTKKQVLRMEHLILKVLNFDVAVPTSNQFLKRYLKAAKANSKTEFLAQYLCELALLDLDVVCHLPSTIAAAAVCLASYSVTEKIWDDTMEFYMKYELDELKPCIKQLNILFQGASANAQQAIYEKYKDAKFDCVATLTAPSRLPFDLESETESESA